MYLSLYASEKTGFVIRAHLVEKAVLWSSFSAEGPRWLLRAVTGVARACGHVLFKVLLNTPIHTTAYKHFQGLALPLSQPHPLSILALSC